MQDVPNLHYFRSGNPFSGSSGRFRYRLAPEEKTNLTASAWFGPYAMNATPETERRQETFPLTEDGLAAAVRWLDNLCEKGESDT